MSRRPAFSFYPADWRNNANLRRCGWGARGSWIEVMGLMHDADEYGVLRWTLKEIAHSIGAPANLVQELARNSVLKGCDAGECKPCIYVPRSGRKTGPPVTLLASQPGPIWFSSRMLKDEYVRTHAGANTRFGTTPGENAAPQTTPSHSPSRRQGDGSSSSSSSSNHESSSRKEVASTPTELARWAARLKAIMWEHWPNDLRVEQMDVRQQCREWIAAGVDLELDAAPAVHTVCMRKRDGAPKTLSYFDVPVREKAATRKAAGASDLAERAARIDLWNKHGHWEDSWGRKPTKRPIDKLPEAA